MTCKQTLVTYKNIRVQRRHKNIWTPHMIRSPMVPSFCKLELPQRHYKLFYEMRFCTKFFNGFLLKISIGFLQIRSHICYSLSNTHHILVRFITHDKVHTWWDHMITIRMCSGDYSPSNASWQTLCSCCTCVWSCKTYFNADITLHVPSHLNMATHLTTDQQTIHKYTQQYDCSIRISDCKIILEWLNKRHGYLTGTVLRDFGGCKLW